MSEQTATHIKEPKKGHKKRPKKGTPEVPVTAPQPEWYRLSAEEVLGRLESRPGGLSDAEATERLEKYGPNEIVEKRRPRP